MKHSPRNQEVSADLSTVQFIATLLAIALSVIVTAVSLAVILVRHI